MSRKDPSPRRVSPPDLLSLRDGDEAQPHGAREPGDLGVHPSPVGRSICANEK